MKNLDEISERIHESFQARTAARDKALAQARTLTRCCANSIRATHRLEKDVARQHLDEANQLVDSLRTDLAQYPDLYNAGYTQDALKEFVEANLVYALLQDGSLPTPEELGVEYATYLNGLAETVGELRRRCLDILRGGYSDEAETLLGYMDEIFGVLVTMDYPNAITSGLRRQTDIVRGIIERTRGDLTMSLRGERLEKKLENLEKRLDE